MAKSDFFFELVDVTPENVAEVGVFCIKNTKAPGYHKKVKWFKDKINNGLSMTIAVDEDGKQLGFIEWTPSEIAWRPIQSKNYFFIHCIALFAKKAAQKGIGSALLDHCEKKAKKNKKDGICVMSSKGSWMANRTVFEKNGFVQVDQKGRFELMSKQINKKSPIPAFVDWTENQKKYKGWNLIYSDQCPWHHKSVEDLGQCASENGIDLKVQKITDPKQAQQAPSGFGTFTLIRDGKELADHYISRTRFQNIIRKELSES